MPYAVPVVDPLMLAERLVGLPYVPGECDCGTLAVRAAREVFGREVTLPQAALAARTAREQGLAIAAGRREMATPVAQPQPGDVALFWEVIGPQARQWHLATVVTVHPFMWLLHTREHWGSQLHRLGDMRRWGLHLDGWYRWN